KYTHSRAYLTAQLAILMGGRVAEELTLDEVTTGAGNDIERATDLARRMVCEWGMSELGPLAFGGGDEPVFLGRDYVQRTEFSEDTAVRIDREIERLVRGGYEAARAILDEHRDLLDLVAQDLLERESLDGCEVYRRIYEKTGSKLGPIAHPAPPDKPAPTDAEEGSKVGASSPRPVTGSQTPDLVPTR